MFNWHETKKNPTDEITISTFAKPDNLSIQRFKESIKKYLKAGFKPKGDLIVKPDGSLVQKLFKPGCKK